MLIKAQFGSCLPFLDTVLFPLFNASLDLLTEAYLLFSKESKN